MTKLFLVCIPLLTLLASGSASPEDLTVRELAAILQIHGWHIPLPAESNQWTIDMVPAGVEPGSKHLPAGKALISLRGLSDNDQYEFTIADQHGQSAGTLRPCAEPKELPPLCEQGFTVSFRDAPVCTGDCSRAIIADVTPMIGEGKKRWIVVSQIKTPIVRPDEKTHVEPIR